MATRTTPTDPRVTRRWLSLRYGDSFLARRWRHKSVGSTQQAELVCQKFVDFYLEQCRQEIVRDRRSVVRSVRVVIGVWSFVMSRDELNTAGAFLHTSNFDSRRRFSCRQGAAAAVP